MIITSPDQWLELYEKIKAESKRSSEKHVNIYASAANADSVCSLKILETLMQNDLVPYSWTAVGRYQEIMNDFLSTYDEDDQVMRFVILINCGAAEDVFDMLGLDQRTNVCLVIIDSCRPITHLFNDNDQGASQTYVLLDEREGTLLSDVPIADAESDADGSDDEDVRAGGRNSQQENDGNNSSRPRQRRRLDGGAEGSPTSSAGGDDGVDNAGEGGHNDDDENSPRRRLAQRKRQRKIRQLDRERYYAKGVHYGKPSACLLFDLACEKNQDTSYLLWLALVGLTDHYVHDRITTEKYEEYYNYYENYLLAKGHMDHVGSYVALDGEGTTTNAASVTCRLEAKEDYKFGLLREWSLWDAMVNSPYVASRLLTYTEKGRKRLEYLLAKLSIPLKEARGSYTFDMQPKYKERLHDNLQTFGPAYNLHDCIFRSFQLQDGFKRCVMAVDTVHAVTALLESGPSRNSVEQGGDAKFDHQDRFWRCWHALSWRNDDGELRRGLELAKKVETALIRDGGSVIMQRLYHNFKTFRVFDLSDHKLGNHNLLVHPMALQRLAAFFQEQMVQYTSASTANTSNRRKPIVLIGPKDPLTGRCLVVGYQVAHSGQGNKLGNAFSAACEEVNAQAWHDLFDTTVMEIMQEDVERFKSELLQSAAELL